MSFDAERFGAAVGQAIADATKPLTERIKQLEERTVGMQSKLDKCMAYAGEWQQANDYPPGSTVRRGSELYVATRHIKSGATLTARDGSGWERVTKGV
ncbi:MAG: hypothetical protein I8H71_10190 [Xanthomonadaceae bacterium]|nr:hypothetical protein [Xanthomonadaceae bacterium]